MCAEARQRSQIGASRRNTGCHEPPSATSLICAAHRAAGLCSRSACVCPAAGTATYTRTGCIAGVSCHAAAPSSCSNRSNSGFSACFGTCPSLSASADLHTSRSVGSQAGSVTALASASLAWHAVSCTVRTAGCAPALYRLADWSQYGWCWTSLGGTDWSLRLFPCTRTSLPPRLTCASTRRLSRCRGSHDAQLRS
jgi:hypothetical protein